MGNQIKVSIIIPAYNTGKYIKQCLDSLLKQTLNNFQIIIVDDGSKDDTFDICKEYEKRFQNFLLFKQKNSGQSVARNYGMKFAKGKYILFLDSDDYIADNSLLTLYEIAEKYRLEVLHFDTINNPRNSKYANKIISGIDYIKYSIENRDYDIAIWSNFISREFIFRHSLEFKENVFFEDQLYTYQLYKYAVRFMKINQPVYYYRINYSSTCNTFSKKKLDDSFKILQWMIDFYQSNEVKEEKDILSLSLYALINIWLNVDPSIQKKFLNEKKARIPKFIYKTKYKRKIQIYLLIALINWKLLKVVYMIEKKIKEVINSEN